MIAVAILILIMVFAFDYQTHHIHFICQLPNIRGTCDVVFEP